jgi:hypothetical protein
MAVIRLPQPYASNHVAMQNFEALQTVGEQIIYLTMFHVNIDHETHPRCSCYDPDYNQQDEFKCPDCYGTTYQGGVKAFCRAWAIVGDAQNQEDFSRQGVWNKERVTAQLEITPTTMTNDYIIRVQQWSETNVPLVLGDRYILEDVGVRSVRTGARFGQVPRQDFFGQKTYMSKVDPNHPIQLYPIDLTVPMPRLNEPLSYGIEMDGRYINMATHGGPL